MDFEMFMSDKAQAVQDTDFAVSERFKDEAGQPIKWKLHPVSAALDKDIKSRCVTGKSFDSLKYIELLTVCSVVYPDLANADLQNSYKAIGKSDLLCKMLTAGELNNLEAKAQDVNGFSQNMDALITDAKN